MAPSTKTLCLDNDLVARVASLLDSAGIPNVLWGNYLLRLFGVPTVVQVCEASPSPQSSLHFPNPITPRSDLSHAKME